MKKLNLMVRRQSQPTNCSSISLISDLCGGRIYFRSPDKSAKSIFSHVPDGELKGALKFGQWKSIGTDRVVLTLGPKEQIEKIRLAYDLFTRKNKTRQEIAEILNERGHFQGRTPWMYQKLYRLFRNPLYRGAYAYAHPYAVIKGSRSALSKT